MGLVRDRLLESYLGFAFGGLHFAVRDISAEIAEAREMLTRFMGREPRFPNRPSRLIHLSLRTDATDEIVGLATREVGLRGAALVVAHKALRIGRPGWREQGFGPALLAANRDWYRECGVEAIVMEAEGDGSAFAAIRGFDFDLASYARRPGWEHLAERELRFAAVERLIHHPAIQETVETGPAPHRESVVDFLGRLSSGGARTADQVRRFQERLPHSTSEPQAAITGDDHTFSSPAEIAAFGREDPPAGRDGRSLGLAVLARAGWSGISTPA